jgi:hypothetical protein
MLAQIINLLDPYIRHLLLSIYIGGLLVLLYVAFFHHIYDIDVWKLKNDVPCVVLCYCSQVDLCFFVLELGQFVMQFILEMFFSY